MRLHKAVVWLDLNGKKEKKEVSFLFQKFLL